MHRRKRLPTISLKQTQTDFPLPTRRRNLSLSSKYEPQTTPIPDCDPVSGQPSSIRLQTMARSYSKKNKLFLFSEKMKKARDLTKLCQENVSQYLQLKDSLRTMKPAPEIQRKHSEGETFQTSPKLSIKFLNIPVNFMLKNAFQPVDGSPKLRMKTEISQKKSIKLRGSYEVYRNCPPSQKPASVSVPPPLSPKKYNQLTMREIVESECEVSDRLQLFQKIKSLKERLRQGVGRAVREREEEPIRGW